MKYKKIKYDRDVQRLMRERKFPPQLRDLYDYFWRAENDDLARGEELLYEYAKTPDAVRILWGYLNEIPGAGEQVTLFDSMITENIERWDDVEMHSIVNEINSVAAGRVEKALWNNLLTIAAEHWGEVVDANDTGCGEDRPSWSLMDYTGAGYGWLVHFGRNASDIAYEGFDKGISIDAVENLALTTHHCEDYSDDEGYNFAYRAGDASRYGFSRGVARYGGEAVIFQAPYLLFDHHGDGEPQCIFWGPSARSIVRVTDASRAPCIELEDDWGVEDGDEDRTIYRRDDYVLEDEDGDEYEAGDELEAEVCFEDYDELARWLDDHLYAVEALNKPVALMKRRKRK